MFHKAKLKKQIKTSQQIIEMLEQKRARSQAAIVSCILTHAEPNDEDVEYFNKFTSQIDHERERLRKLKAELEKA